MRDKTEACVSHSLLKVDSPPFVARIKLASTSQDTTVFSCKATPLYISDELNYVSSITLNLEIRSFKRKCERKKKR